MSYLLLLVISVVLILLGFSLCFFNSPSRWHKWFPTGWVLDSLGAILIVIGCLGLFILTIPLDGYASYRDWMGRTETRGVADPLRELMFVEQKATGTRTVTWKFPDNATPLWVAITVYRDPTGTNKETFVRSATAKAFDDPMALEKAVKVTTWYGTPSGPSGLAETDLKVQ
ncbi:MAG: hypothetical protein PHW10_05225 [Candidatus Peribacteraceae bacterium]|nr:hypothetical protein [Candidatus Peribacteraceae bacterium]